MDENSLKTKKPWISLYPRYSFYRNLYFISKKILLSFLLRTGGLLLPKTF